MQAILWSLIGDFLVTVVQAIIMLNIVEEILGLKNEKYKVYYYLISPIAVYLCDKPLMALGGQTGGYNLTFHIVWLGTFYVCLLIFLKGKLLEKLVYLMIAFLGNVIPQMILVIFFIFVLNLSEESFAGIWSPVWFFLCAFTYAAHYVLGRFVIAAATKKKAAFPKKQVLLISVFVIFMLVMGVVLWPNRSYAVDSDHGLEVSTVWFTVAMLLIGIVSCVYIIYSKKLTRSKRELLISENKLKEQYRRMENINEQEQQIRKIRHDFKNHITTGLALMSEGKIKEAEKYFSEYLDSELTASRQFISTGYESVNAIVNKKLTECFDLDIKVSASVTGEFGSIAEMDLCVVLFNLLDNAIEGCSSNTGESEIKLEIFRNKAYLVVSVSNTIDGSVLETNPNLKTSKRNKKHHGIGLDIVKDVCVKYNGMFNADENDNVFTVDVWLQNK